MTNEDNGTLRLPAEVESFSPGQITITRRLTAAQAAEKLARKIEEAL